VSREIGAGARARHFLLSLGFAVDAVVIAAVRLTKDVL
jgi:hypothetical protein